ncbi:acetate/propionate family kinase [Ideonella sp.]|uniref:acetate/propionate family kinase n=1 Tax=Ideonella sp. TaxID=1929293 RepID=UPI003BB7248E
MIPPIGPEHLKALHGQPAVLAVNAGSSSLKFGLYGRAPGPAAWSGQFEGLEPGGQPVLKVRGQADWAPQSVAGQSGFRTALNALVAGLAQAGVPLRAVAHRIVHGGERCTTPCRLDADTMAYLATLDSLAPLHQPHNLAGVQAFAQALPDLPQVGCFDTGFHATLPQVERQLPIARQLEALGLRRYGFHGLSYQYVQQVLGQHSSRAQGRVLMAHLGNGASVCATLAGRSVATSMGFSALDGLMMGTRSGALDPGVLLHLWRLGWSREQVESLLYKESGLKGVSGLSADMRSLRASSDPAAAEAIALFSRRLLREVGAMLAILGGADLIAFTGGIGEHDHRLRAELAQHLAWAGVRINPAANAAASGDLVQAIHSADSSVELWVVPTDEGRVAALAAWQLLEPLEPA